MSKEATPESRQRYRDALAEARHQAAEWRSAADELDAELDSTEANIAAAVGERAGRLEDTTAPCDCGWLYSEPKEGTVEVHDELVQMDGPQSLRHLADALSARMNYCEPPVEPLDALVSRHSFSDQSAAFDLAQLLEELVTAYDELAMLKDYVANTPVVRGAGRDDAASSSALGASVARLTGGAVVRAS